MRSVNPEIATAIAAADIGVLAWIAADGVPRSCAITPYVVGDDVVITSTLAYVAKVAAIHQRPGVAVLAGGVQAQGHARIAVDLTSATFDQQIRNQELAKFPPARALLGIPFHRRLLPWYVGRAFIRVGLDRARVQPGGHRITVAAISEGHPILMALGDETDLTGTAVEVGAAVPDGPATILVHEEHREMSDLRQLTLKGTVAHGVLSVERRNGTLEPGPHGTIQDLRALGRMRAAAHRNRAAVQRLAAESS